MKILKNDFILLLAACLVSYSSVLASSSPDSLFSNFQNPPEAAKPRTWWHWTGGNVTKEGITKDLEWMQRVGIGGFQLADVAFGAGQEIETKVMFGTPEWLELVHHAAKEADRLNLEMAIFSSAGWSLTGGPWVKPEQAMKKLVFSDTLIHGSQQFIGTLPHPPSNNGPIGNLGRPSDDPTFYNDVAVLAYRSKESATNMKLLHLSVTSNAGPIDASALFDGDLNSTLTIPAPKSGEPVWIQFEFDQPFAAHAFTIANSRGIPQGNLLVSKDGQNFRTLITLPGAQLYRQGWARTFSFPQTHAKIYRIELTGIPLRPAEAMAQFPTKSATEYVLAEAVLHADARIHRWEEKAGFRHLFEYESVPTPEIDIEDTIQPDALIDLTAKMDKSGTLKWNVPKGNWQILRIGYSLTGAKNRPAMKTGLGFEVDKLSRKHTEAYIRHYTQPILETLGPLYGNSLGYVLMDSWEAGMQNWTDDMLDEFQKRRGYDARPYLPALAGRVIKSAEVSDRFLWDFRRTLADMFAENHYGVIADFLRQQGIGTYGEASGVSLEILEDALLCKKFMDIPMGEFWMRALHPELMYYQDVRGAASAAHVYGKKLVAAEAFTGGGYESPFAMKRVADYWFCQGINRLVFHTSAHQPLDTKPGNTMVGTHINRNITWAEEAKPFMNYLARISFVLQQGQFVADIAYLLNEGAPSTMPIWGAGLQPEPPAGYDYDFINTDVLLNRLSVNAKGELALPDGMKYKILVLPSIERMTLPVVQKLRILVENGATIVGPKPVASPSLGDYPQSDAHVKALAEQIWGDLDGLSRFRRTIGKGTVVWGLPLEMILNDMNIAKDVEYSRTLDMELHWIHRRVGNTDIYFVVNECDQPQNITARFRVDGKIPEVWFPDSGEHTKVPYKVANGRTTVEINLPQHASAFVVFQSEIQDTTVAFQKQIQTTLNTIDGAWDVEFPENNGAPARFTFDHLQSWTEQTNEDVKYFSGTATYTKSFKTEKSWFQNNVKLQLNLGDVNDVAEVSLNGKSLGIHWKPPYTFDVTAVLKPGTNHLQIHVTNQWTNRLLGDRNPDIKHKVLPAGSEKIRFFGPQPDLSPSGLLGPVRLISLQEK